MRTLTEKDFIHFVGKKESQFISPASEWTDELIKRFNGDISISGDLLPWNKTHDNIRLRPGEVSIWGGYNGHGKSQLLNQVCAWNLSSKRWLIASMEMKPSATMYRMTRQVSCSRTPSDEFVKEFMKWTNGRLWIYDQLDTVKQERIIGMVHYAAQELNIDHIIIDSLMKCGIETDDYNAQKEFVDKLCWAAKSENIHIHLIHHMRKGQSEYSRPGKHDFRGAGELTDLADNLFVVFRNKQKEQKRREGKSVNEKEGDCILYVDKQRHGEWEGGFQFWFQKESMQYISNINNISMPFNETIIAP